MSSVHLPDMFGRKIMPGDSFMRIENAVGGSNLRYYFFGGYTADRKVHVQEYGGVPRIINTPHCRLMLLTEELMTLQGFIPPTIDEVTAPPPAKKAKAKKGEHIVI